MGYLIANSLARRSARKASAVQVAKITSGGVKSRIVNLVRLSAANVAKKTGTR